MDWALKNSAGLELGRVLNYTPGLERVKIVTRLYDGSYNVQTVGVANETAVATVLVTDMSALRAVNLAEASGELLTLKYRDTDYTGYLDAKPSWKPIIAGSVYTASLRFLVLPG